MSEDLGKEEIELSVSGSPDICVPVCVCSIISPSGTHQPEVSLDGSIYLEGMADPSG